RPVHRCLPAARAGDDDARSQSPRLPLPGPAAGVHRLQGVLADLPRLRVPGLQVRHADRDDHGERVMTATRALLEGSEAIADAMIAAGCRFFSGYPMTPFTEILEEMARKLPAVGG